MGKRYYVILDFNDFDDRLTDVWGTRFNLPNGTLILFWECKIHYVNSNDSHYLKIVSKQKQNIRECLILLSFFTTLPLSTLEYNFNHEDEDDGVIPKNKQLNNSAVMEWKNKLDEINRKLKTKRNKKRRDEILSLMQMCSIGALHDYREHQEEQFFMYFKPIERVSKMVLDKAKKSKESIKKATKDFLEKLLLSDFNNTVFDENTLNELVGKLNSTLESSLKTTNHRRIVLALNNIVNSVNDRNSAKEKLRAIDSERIQELVKIRNDIAHGGKVTIKDNDLVDVEYLARQMIVLFFFGFNFKRGYLKTKKFNNDFWS